MSLNAGNTEEGDQVRTGGNPMMLGTAVLKSAPDWNGEVDWIGGKVFTRGT